MDRSFEFEYITRCVVKADNITEAMEKFSRNECESVVSDTRPRMLKHVHCTDEKGTRPMAMTISKETGQAIWYEPGCINGYTECIFDPMEEIAAACASQKDLTPDKQTECKDFDEEDGRCQLYDDECK